MSEVPCAAECSAPQRNSRAKAFLRASSRVEEKVGPML